MYAKAAAITQRIGVTPATLRRWARAGKIDYTWSNGGIRLYQLPDKLPDADVPVDHVKKKVVYARVSSPKQKDDLQRQADYLQSQFPQHVVVTDIGSGINWKRKGLLSLLDDAHAGALEEVVVASRDRLCRFAFDLLAHVFKQRGVRLVVLDADTADESAERELSDDLLSIVQVFCCRRNGKRRYTKAEQGPEDAEDQDQPHKVAKAEAE